MKILVMQLSPPSHHSIPLWSKYSPQHPVKILLEYEIRTDVLIRKSFVGKFPISTLGGVSGVSTSKSGCFTL
jgi:hypothetical protein